MNEVPQTPPTPPNVELILAQQANRAIQQGYDPDAVTQGLHQVITHLRSNPSVAADAQERLRRGADPDQLSDELFQRAMGEQAVQGLRGIPSAVGKSLVAPAESFGDLIAPDSASAAKMNAPNSQYQQSMMARFGQEIPTHPVTGQRRLQAGLETAANIAAIPLSELKPILGPMLAGGAVGAAYDHEHPVRGALIGAGTGGATAAAPHVLGSVGEALGSDALSPFKERAYGMTLQSLADDAKTLQGLRGARAQYPDNAPLSIADLAGRNTRLRAQSVRTLSGPGSEEIENALLDRRAAQPGRVAQSVDRNLGTQGKNYFSERQNTIDQLRDEDTANYGAAFSEKPGPVADPRLEAIMKTSAWKRAVPAAQRIAANEGVEWSAPSQAGGIPSKAAEFGFSPEQWADVLKKSGVNAPETAPSGPTLQQLHYVKMAMDDMKEGKVGLAPDEGSGIGKTEARSVGKVQKQLLGVMDDWSDTYKNARANSSELRGQLGAGALGRTFTQGDPEEMAAVMDAKAKTPAQQDQYRVGAARTIKGQVGRINPSKGQYATDVPALANNPLAQMRLAKLAPSPDAYNALGTDLGAERMMNDTEQTIRGGSNTTDKALMAAQLMSRGPTKFAMKAAGGNFGGIMKAVFQDALTERAMKGASGTAAEMAPIYSAGMREPVQPFAPKTPPKNPAEQFNSILDALEQYQHDKSKGNAAWQKGGLLAGVLSGYANGQAQQP